MVSDFRKKKLEHVFTAFFDTNKSGSVDKKDFELAIANISKTRGWNTGSARFKEFEDTLMKIWEGVQKQGDSDGDGQVTLDEWIEMCDQYVKNPSGEDSWLPLYAKFMFKLEDASNDGSIDCDEFSSVYASFGLNKDEAAAAFSKMSKGKDSVTWPEFKELWKEYFSSENADAPGNFIFGKTSF